MTYPPDFVADPTRSMHVRDVPAGMPPSHQPDSMEWDDLSRFIGKNAEAFRSIAGEKSARRTSIAANCWPAFFVPGAWFLYRKMYGLAAIATLSPMVLYLILPSPVVLRWLGFFIGLVGLQGKRLYLRHAQQLINSVNSYARDEDERRDLISRAGGVSVAGAWIGAIITLTLTAMPFFVRYLFKPA